MTDRVAVSSPRLNARIAGFVYLCTGAAVFAVFTRSTLIVGGDAMATAHNILASELVFRLAVASDLIAFAAYIGVTAILYELLKPVSRSLSLVAAFFGLAGCATSAVYSVNYLVPLILLGGQNYLAAFAPEQLHALALVSLKLSAIGATLGMMFFGFYCLLLGCLIIESTFLPRIIGVLLVITGLCYLAYTFASFLVPTFAAHLLPGILLPGLAGEGSLGLWLLVVGVNASKWQKQASAAGECRS